VPPSIYRHFMASLLAFAGHNFPFFAEAPAFEIHL
jgi:hypothetical protein